MIVFTNTIAIERPVNEVFDHLSDLTRIPEWNWAITSTEKLEPGPVALGSKYRQVRHTPSHQVEFLEITAFQPGRLLTIHGTLGPFPARVTYALAVDGRSTRVVNTVELEPPGPLMAAAPLLRAKVSRSVAENLATLKQLLERGRQGAATSIEV